MSMVPSPNRAKAFNYQPDEIGLLKGLRKGHEGSSFRSFSSSPTSFLPEKAFLRLKEKGLLKADLWDQ